MTAAIETARPGGARAWVIWALGASAFGYAFFQRVAPSVMVGDLMREFAVTAAVLGNLSAIYFYAYAGLQIPIGVLIDRWGARAMISGSLALAGAGSLIFALATTVELAYLGRLLIGAGSAVGFVGTLTLASRWFPPHRFAFLAGLTMLVGMISGVGGQGPLSTLVEAIGWRSTLIAAGAAGVLLAAAVWLVVRNAPPSYRRPRGVHGTGWRQLAHNIALVMANWRIWNIALVGLTLSGPLLAFGSLWGVPYMITRYDLSRPEAAFCASLMLIGWAIGAPAGGWLSDHLGRRKAPLVLATMANTGLLATLFYLPALPLAGAMALIFTIGLVGAVMVVGYAFARENTPPEAEGTVTGFVNAMTVGSGALFQPIIGILLDLRWSGEMAEGARVYSVEAYTFALTSLVVVAGLGVLGALITRETWCRPYAAPSGTAGSPAPPPPAA